MSLKEWERDVINRQRNIVFPDTNLNEGRFYRNIASGKAVFSRGQKVSLLLILAFFIVVHAVDFAGQISFVISRRAHVRQWSVWPSIASFIWLLFWIFLTVKALLLTPAPARKRRRGYRQSSKA
ncbi:MAG TPA: hypothetical protein VKV30_01115 [Candidatus Angelobacter sp.]|nr:hypothetical protein [Candidatus Angelobacter sp.]